MLLVFPKEKDGFGQENQLFPRQKMVWAWKTNFYPSEKDGFGKENQLFPWENQKNKNTIFWETMRPKSTKMVTPKPSLA